jgi:branched-chain amino acid aminotransferase
LGPARVVIAREVRRNAHSPLARIKALSYLDNILARLEAQERGADDALLLNTEGRLAESTIANLFVVLANGTIVTPPVTEGALPGVRRATLLAELGAEERPLPPEALDDAREAFLSNALSIRPLVAVDGRPIADGMPGGLTRRLLDGMDRP